MPERWRCVVSGRPTSWLSRLSRLASEFYVKPSPHVVSYATSRDPLVRPGVDPAPFGAPSGRPGRPAIPLKLKLERLKIQQPGNVGNTPKEERERGRNVIETYSACQSPAACPR